jgi:hypothetical protein
MERQIKHIHAEMIALRNKEASGVKLTRDERTQLGRLAAEHDSLAFVGSVLTVLLHTNDIVIIR